MTYKQQTEILWAIFFAGIFCADNIVGSVILMLCCMCEGIMLTIIAFKEDKKDSVPTEQSKGE